VARRREALERLAAEIGQAGGTERLQQGRGADAGVGDEQVHRPQPVGDAVDGVHSVAAVADVRRGGDGAAVSSLGAYKGLPRESGYCASKAAVNAFMEGLRIQLRGKGVAVTTICPGFVRTPMTEVAAAIREQSCVDDSWLPATNPTGLLHSGIGFAPRAAGTRAAPGAGMTARRSAAGDAGEPTVPRKVRPHGGARRR
jgi:NAD(P)-dependent dehydrogenase (short-subunit alcohol dehydrogenase family)